MILHLQDIPVVSKKNRLKFGKGRAYKPKSVTSFEEELRRAATECAPPQPLLGPLRMSITVTVPNRIRRDLQNFSDTICDALNGVWYADDCQIEELHMRKVYASDRRWSLTVAVEEYENAHLP
jgi:hypothetical protein